MTLTERLQTLQLQFQTQNGPLGTRQPSTRALNAAIRALQGGASLRRATPRAFAARRACPLGPLSPCSGQSKVASLGAGQQTETASQPSAFPRHFFAAEIKTQRSLRSAF